MLAQEEARLMNCHMLGSEHLLLALLGQDDTVARDVLNDAGIELVATREQVADTINPPDERITGHIGFTPRAKRVLSLGLSEALSLGHDWIGTEHLLLGLLRDGDGIGCQVIAGRLSHSEARRSVIRQITEQSRLVSTAISVNPADVDFSSAGEMLRVWFDNAYEGVEYGRARPSQAEAEGVLAILLARMLGAPLEVFKSG